MKSNILYPENSRTRHRTPLAAAMLGVSFLFAAQRGSAVAAASKQQADPDPDPEPDEDQTGEEAGGDDAGETSQAAGTTATGTGTGAAAKTTNKTVEEAAANTELVTLIKTYDETKAQAQSYMCDIAEFINKNNLGRPIVIKTLMEARGLTLESAASNASRLMKLAKNPDLIQALRDGTATIREPFQ